MQLHWSNRLLGLDWPISLSPSMGQPCQISSGCDEELASSRLPPIWRPTRRPCSANSRKYGAFLTRTCGRARVHSVPCRRKTWLPLLQASALTVPKIAHVCLSFVIYSVRLPRARRLDRRPPAGRDGSIGSGSWPIAPRLILRGGWLCLVAVGVGRQASGWSGLLICTQSRLILLEANRSLAVQFSRETIVNIASLVIAAGAR